MTAPLPPSDQTTGFWFVHEPNFKYVVAGVPIVTGVLIFLGFFISPWIAPDADDATEAALDKAEEADKLIEEARAFSDQDDDGLRVELVAQVAGFGLLYDESKSAWAIWTGAEGAVLRFDKNYEGEVGFGQVETRDRLLIFIPLLALGLVGVGVAYLTDRLHQRQTLIAIIIIAALLFVLPLFWQMLKTNYMRTGIDDVFSGGIYSQEANDEFVDIAVASYTTIYSTFEFVFLSFIALLFGAGTYLILQSEYKRLGTGWPGKAISPQPPPPAAPQPPPPAA